MRMICGVVLLLTAFAAGCGGNGNPAAPTAFRTTASLAIDGPDVLLTDASSNYTTSFHVGGWDTVLSEGGAMRGQWAHRLSGVPTDRPPFNGYQEIELVTMTRSH